MRESDDLVTGACGDVLWGPPVRPELALGLLDAQIRAQAQSLTTLKAAVTRADAWRGDRGEADETAAQILTLLD